MLVDGTKFANCVRNSDRAIEGPQQFEKGVAASKPQIKSMIGARRHTCTRQRGFDSRNSKQTIEVIAKTIVVLPINKTISIIP
jgi:hypothetical protein